MATLDEALVRFRSFYETFSEAWLGRLEELYAPGFTLRDPFHTIDGDFPALRAYLRRVLHNLHSSRFIVEDDATGRAGSYVRWRWEWQRRAAEPLHSTDGITHLRFNDEGRITHHRDLFDAGEIYESLPVVGTALRAIKQRV